jgi:hypothetical protein
VGRETRPPHIIPIEQLPSERSSTMVQRALQKLSTQAGHLANDARGYGTCACACFSPLYPRWNDL